MTTPNLFKIKQIHAVLNQTKLSPSQYAQFQRRLLEYGETAAAKPRILQAMLPSSPAAQTENGSALADKSKLAMSTAILSMSFEQRENLATAVENLGGKAQNRTIAMAYAVGGLMLTGSAGATILFGTGMASAPLAAGIAFGSVVLGIATFWGALKKMETAQNLQETIGGILGIHRKLQEQPDWTC